MILSDVSFGIFAFLPQGWVFMLFVIIIECVIITRYLTKKLYDKKLYIITTLSNLISGITGILMSLKLNGGWYLVVWFPWVSSNEINLKQKGVLFWLTAYYIAAFILSLIIEGIFNILILKKTYAVKNIIMATIIANVVSYAVGSLVLYSYSFGLIK